MENTNYRYKLQNTITNISNIGVFEKGKKLSNKKGNAISGKIGVWKTCKKLSNKNGNAISGMKYVHYNQSRVKVIHHI